MTIPWVKMPYTTSKSTLKSKERTINITFIHIGSNLPKFCKFTKTNFNTNANSKTITNKFTQSQRLSLFQKIFQKNSPHTINCLQNWLMKKNFISNSILNLTVTLASSKINIKINFKRELKQKIWSSKLLIESIKTNLDCLVLSRAW